MPFAVLQHDRRPDRWSPRLLGQTPTVPLSGGCPTDKERCSYDLVGQGQTAQSSTFNPSGIASWVPNVTVANLGKPLQGERTLSRHERTIFVYLPRSSTRSIRT